MEAPTWIEWLVAVSSVSALAGERELQGGRVEDAGAPRRERIEDARIAVAAPRTAPGASAPIQFGPYTIHQVNVAANGANILGDAANEPSIAVDPTDPDVMAIAWRQFDTIASNFRQAGRGYSRDGGR